MADGNITSVLEKLGNLVVQEASLLGQVEGQVRLLQTEMEWMRVLLEDEDVDEKSNRDKRLKVLVNQTRDVAYDAEDVIDEFMFEIQSRQQSWRAKVVGKFLPTCVSYAHKLPFIHELDDRIRDINIRIEKILANKDRYKIDAGSTSSEGIPVQREKRVPTVEVVDVVGMANETEEVKQMLVEGDSERQVVAIVGMGGLGKTTLAKKVYHRVNNHFDCRAWVYVSQQYTIRELLQGIMADLDVQSKTKLGDKNEDWGNHVKNYLQGRRYLIVLDDVWSTEVWGELCLYLPESEKRSRVLITTRDQLVASDAHAQLYPLSPLGEKESWELFCKKAFPMGDVLPEELKGLAKEITEKCDGLPLAIVLIGGLLSRKEKTEHSWKKIYESMEWHLKQGPDSCMGILALSYNNLPYYLKSCFLYCGVFPEDHEIKAGKLMQMWIAEGFVQGRDKETAEDVAEDYLEELIGRSMIQVGRRKWDGIGTKSCRIHDLLRDLAIAKAKDSKFLEVKPLNINLQQPFNPRRLIIHGSTNISRHEHLHGYGRLRSLIVYSDLAQVSLIHFLRTKLLTVLNLQISVNYYRGELELPKEIGELVHLKYFSLKGVALKLPWSIGKLINLKVLDLRHCAGEIPSSIWNLRQLSHLYTGFCRSISRQSTMRRCLSGHDLGVDKMTNLQTLHLNRWLDDGTESCDLGKLTRLRKLYLYWRILLGKPPLITYPSNLVELKLKNCDWEQDQMWTVSSLPNLRALMFNWRSYYGEKMTCFCGGFPRLEFLRLHGLPHLKELELKEGALPGLKTLQIFDCPRIQSLSVHELSKLRNLKQVKLHKINPTLAQEIETLEGTQFHHIRRITYITLFPIILIE